MMQRIHDAESAQEKNTPSPGLLPLLHGGLLLLVLIAFPKGLVGLWNTLCQRLSSMHDKPRLKSADRVAP